VRVAALLLLALAVAGCGGASSGPPAVVVALDFTPNPVHAPIYMAAREPSHGVRLQIRKPGSGPDSLKLVASGKVDLGVLDIQDLAIAQTQGVGVVAVGELIDRPLGALVARPDIARPRDLEGRTVGVSGLPSDPAFVSAIVRHDGGDPAKIKEVTIGFAAVSRLLTHRVDAVPAFWNAEGVTLRRRGLPVREFRVDDYGAPSYPELVVVATRRTLDEQPALARATVAALVRGYTEVLSDPESAVEEERRAGPDLDRAQLQAQLDAVAPAFIGNAPRFGALQPRVLAAWAQWEARFGIVRRPPVVAATFDASFLPRP
jgi:putative hydroxymethylpyrimidine transport system substrate-binding protein